MNKKSWYSIIIIGIVIILSITGSISYFSATRTTSVNRFAVGTLDLSIKDKEGLNEPFILENLGHDPYMKGKKEWKIKNTGSLTGRLIISISNLVNNENGCANDQERLVDPNCDNPNKEGNLGGVINLILSINDRELVSSNLATKNQDLIGNKWLEIEPIILKPSEEKIIKAHWSADPSMYGNEIQGDDVQFDLNFRLIQNIGYIEDY